MNDEAKYLISVEQMQAMVDVLVRRPTDILLIESCRQFLAHDRWQKSGQALRIYENIDPGVMPGTIAHNRREVEQSIFRSARRTLRLINPLSAIEPVYSRPQTLRVLSIGPRTEMELLHLYGIGFVPENVVSVDLISSSPLIEPGDMHHLAYPNSSFDVVICGWTIAYSSRPQRAMDEMMRVCKPGGLIAVGCSYDPVPERAPDAPVRETDISGNSFGRAADLAALMGERLGEVCFQHQPIDTAHPGPVMLIARLR